MADEKGNIDIDKVAQFKPTMELRWCDITDEASNGTREIVARLLQQKWVNELGEYEWRDIPLVIE